MQSNLRTFFFAAVCILTVLAFAGSGGCLAQTPPAKPTAQATPLPRSDANGNPLRRAPTGHVSNYDEAKVGNYTLPDPLVLANGQPVRDAETWLKLRRPEILKLYETHIFGRVPERAPKVTWTIAETDTKAMDGTAVRKHIVGRIGDGPDAPTVNVMLHLPAKATGPVPVLMQMNFFGNPPAGAQPAAPKSTNTKSPPAAPITSKAPGKAPGAGTPIADLLARGYGYATFRYTEFQPDNATNALRGVVGLALAPGQAKPAADEWGGISAWAWGASRVLDYFETDKSVDARRVALIGHSRLGKTVLWAGARDPRFAVMFSSCSGEMGASLARRDFGETVDDMAANFPWQFCGNFQKFSGKWNEMPVDAHMVIALNAPRPVFVTGGTQDQWADPHGEFLAQVAAGPVYRLLGKKDLGITKLPALDTPLTSGELGFHYHTGGHTITAADWKAFLEFAERYLKPTP